MRGKFIVLEGVDGAGKSTQLALLAARLRELGRKVELTAEPTSSALGGLLRDALSGLTPRSSGELAALFLADRVAHNENPVSGIKKALSQGTDVLCDRYYYSSFAYQGLDSEEDWVYEMNLNCPAIQTPDLCVFLDLDPERCEERMTERGERPEIFENREALRRTRERYQRVFERLAGRENIRIVDADAPAEKVSERIFALVRELL